MINTININKNILLEKGKMSKNHLYESLLYVLKENKIDFREFLAQK